MEDLKQLLKVSGLQVGEFGMLCNVSRITVHTWMTGGKINELRVGRVDKVKKAISAAVAAGELPLGELSARKRGTKEAREALIKKIVLKQLQQAAAMS